MALNLTQIPASVQPAQSPVIFTVAVDSGLYSASRFQYTCKLDYWNGSIASPANTSSFNIYKYPNTSGVGIFDLSKILYSALRSNLIDTTSSLIAYQAEFNYQYYNGSSYVVGTSVGSTTKLVYDGYSVNPESVNEDISAKGLYPFLTDGPVTQSVMTSDKGTIALYVTSTRVVTYTGVYSNGSTDTQTITLTGGSSTGNRIKQAPLGCSESGFPLNTTNLLYFTISAGSYSIRVNVVCEPKYNPIRIGFKNRFGQLDYFNFYKASRQSFSTTQRTFQPNVGNWNSSTFGINNYVNQTQRYIVDNEQSLKVQSDFINEEYNEIFKQLLVSDEIYWFNGSDIIPVSIVTSNVQFKQGRIDKLISYEFDFTLGRNYKCIV